MINAFSTMGSPWSDLILKDGDTTLRILAPGKLSSFQSDYLQAYIESCWQQYTNQSLTLQPTVVSGVTYHSTGQVDADNNFVFTTDNNGGTHSIAQPTTIDVFACNGVFDLVGSGDIGTIDGDIKNQVSSAMNRTILLTSDSSTWCDSSAYYLNSATNYYSKILHANSINSLCYGFPYDDRCNQSSDVSDPSPTEIALTLTTF